MNIESGGSPGGDGKSWHGAADGSAACCWLACPLNSPELIPAEARDFPVARRAVASGWNHDPDQACGDARDWPREYAGDFTALRLADLCEDHNLLIREVGEHQYEIVCPWHEQHTSGQDLACIWNRPGEWPGFHCFHNHCQHRKLPDLLVALGGPAVVGTYFDQAYRRDHDRFELAAAQGKIAAMYAGKQEKVAPPEPESASGAVPRPGENVPPIPALIGRADRNDPRFAYLWKGRWVVLIAVAFLTLQWLIYLAVMSSHPAWLLAMWGPGVDWPFVQNVWFWAMAAFKFCVWLMVLVVLWLTLWARQLRKMGASTGGSGGGTLVSATGRVGHWIGARHFGQRTDLPARRSGIDRGAAQAGQSMRRGTASLLPPL
jgi:hypothetical protein